MNNPKQLTFPWNKSYKSSFNNFYVDPANAQLISSIQTDFSSENLYIFGVKNSGKTYLLQSLCNLYSNKNKSVLFLPLKEVMTYGTEILDAIENMDLVCIDGMEEIVGVSEWETAVFNLINNSLQSGCKIIFTSSMEKGATKFSLPDLDSRVRKLESFELFPISDHHILDALKHIANLRSINLGDNEAQYLITYTKRSISDLVQILESLDQLSMEMKRKITIPLIKEII